jgi:hypothetical protein
VPATSGSDWEWTAGHSPAIVLEPKPTASLLQTASQAAPPPASTLSIILKRSPGVLNTSKSTKKPRGSLPSTPDYFLTNCHTDDCDWIYFTLLSPDDSFALDTKGKRILYYVSKEWVLTYPETVRKALFNDPEPYFTCPEGHCRSAIVPGTELRLELVKNPKVFRAGWNEGSCGYVDDVQTTGRNLVTRGKFGYLKTGATLNDVAVAFVERQLLATYPTLEIGLILGFTVGLFVVLPLVVAMAVCLYYCAKETVLRAIDGKSEDAGQSARLSDPAPPQGYGYAAKPPPAYSAV